MADKKKSFVDKYTNMAFKVGIALFLVPTLIAVGFNQLLWVWIQLPIAPKVVVLLALPAILMLLLHMLIPNASWSKQFQQAIYDGYKFVIVAPFRLIGVGYRYLRRP